MITQVLKRAKKVVSGLLTFTVLLSLQTMQGAEQEFVIDLANQKTYAVPATVQTGWWGMRSHKNLHNETAFYKQHIWFFHLLAKNRVDFNHYQLKWLKKET